MTIGVEGRVASSGIGSGVPDVWDAVLAEGLRGPRPALGKRP
jgi:hypothetical protein